MKKLLISTNILLLTVLYSIAQIPPGTPLAMNGRLKLVGKQLSNQCGKAIQLRGMSTHAVMSHQNCYTAASIEALAKDWKSDFIRLAIYTEKVGETNGYIHGDRTSWNNWIDQVVNLAEKNGIYVIIDWHILEDNDPNKYINEAKEFFGLMSKKYKNKRHVLYEICNEPNRGVNWDRIKTYADQIIPIIRTQDTEGIILVGTPDWSSKPGDVVTNPLSTANAYNVMYTFHFYAVTHTDYNYLKGALGKVPVFVSEWGTTEASGMGGYSESNSNEWLKVLNGDNTGGVKVSWANWAFVDKSETSAALTPNACSQAAWTSRTASGNYIHKIISSADAFTQCQAAADDDNDGVANGDDICPGTVVGATVDSKGCKIEVNDTDKDGVIDTKDLCAGTPAGTPVTAFGCEIPLNFLSNVCVGLNNFQGYARNDFSVDSLTNVDFWNRPSVKNSVYSASVANGELVVNVTNGDPTYKTMGFSFGVNPDSSLIPIDVRPHPTVKLDVFFQPKQGVYTLADVMLDIQIEDADGNVLSTDALKNLKRQDVALNKWVTIVADFKDGYRQSYDAKECGATMPCYFNKFDFSRLAKVLMWVNPGAGETWAKGQAFNGIWKIDNFSVGYDPTSTAPCTSIRDDDKDGVKQEIDRCPGTTTGSTVNTAGCATNQLDDDKDGVTNDVDQCPNSSVGVQVNATGCTITTGMEDVMEFNGLTVYPVPAKEKLTIDQKTKDYDKATLMDVTGNFILSIPLNKSVEELSFENLPKGVYLLQVNGAEKSKPLRIVIQ